MCDDQWLLFQPSLFPCIETNTRDGNRSHTWASAGHAAESMSGQDDRLAENAAHRERRVWSAQLRRLGRSADTA